MAQKLLSVAHISIIFKDSHQHNIILAGGP